MSLVSGFAAMIKHRRRGRGDSPAIGFGLEPLEVSDEQLPHWQEHPNDIKMFRHTAETALAARGRPVPPVQPAMFAIRLPFDLPVPDGAAFGLRRSADPTEPIWVTLMVHRVRVEPAAALLAPYENGLAVLLRETKPKLKRGFSGQTWILASTLNVGFDDEPYEMALQPGGAISIALERCLRAVNIVSDASRMVARDIHSRPLTKESLDPRITWFDVDMETGLLLDRHEMRLHNRKYNPRIVARDPADMHRLLSEAVSRRLESEAASQPHPFFMPRTLSSQARGQRWHGEASASIITLQTAAETLLAGLYRLLLVDQGLDAASIDNKMQASFRSLLRTRLPEALGGRWTGAGAIPEQYSKDVYDVRNDLAHAGREPRWWMLNTAFESYETLVHFIDERLLDGWRHHPRTLVAWCEAWAGGSLDLPPAAQPIADSLLSESRPYWLPFDMAMRVV